MYRAPYRNFGNYEAGARNDVSDVSSTSGLGGDAKVRWYELRKSGGGPWEIYQQSTYAPDLITNRFTGTISTTGLGNIALGYTVCSNQTYPGLRLTGRRAGDPLNEMSIAEFTLVPASATTMISAGAITAIWQLIRKMIELSGLQANTNL